MNLGKILKGVGWPNLVRKGWVANGSPIEADGVDEGGHMSFLKVGRQLGHRWFVNCGRLGRGWLVC